MRPPLKELPVIDDARSSGLRLQARAPKSLPPITDVSSGSSSRAIEAAEYAAAVGVAFASTKAINKRSAARAKAKDRILQERSNNFGKRKR